ncbi:hypothetical protein F4778DRAFT_91962 [Xylariomycetidae sp. FL2044]|nr:hypothetical protein F4778DRAFT_91962 [Xylariomycetidae sp. FL2044]
MTLQPYDKVRESMRPDLINIADAREYAWAGHNTLLMHNILSDGQIVQFAIASFDEDAAAGSVDLWQRTVSAEEIKKMYQDWPPHLNKTINERRIVSLYSTLVSRISTPLCTALKPILTTHVVTLQPAPTPGPVTISGTTQRPLAMSQAPVCVTGDAAHSTTPWQGSGGGMSIEDSLILSSVLGHAKNPLEALVGSQVYDRVRRPRTQRIVESSSHHGYHSDGTGRGGTGPGEAQVVLLALGFSFIDIDMERHRDEALEMMDGELKLKGLVRVGGYQDLNRSVLLANVEFEFFLFVFTVIERQGTSSSP